MQLTDGTRYTYSATAAAASSNALGQSLMSGTGYDFNGDGYNLYLDPNGYVIGVEGYDAGVSLDNYLFVRAFANNGFDLVARAIFMDGTEQTIVVDKIGGTDVDANSGITTASNGNNFYTFDTGSNGNYELTVVATVGTNVVTQSNKTSVNISNDATPISTVDIPGNSSTVFIADDRLYTGVSNAPTVTSATVYYLISNEGRLMAVYTPSKGTSSSSTSDELIYILSETPEVAMDGDDEYYIYNAIVNGEVTAVESNTATTTVSQPGLYKINSYTDDRADLSSRIAASDGDLVAVVNTVTAASYADGTLTLTASGSNTSYILSDDVQLFTVDGDTVKTISASAVSRNVANAFDDIYLLETSGSNSDILTIYLVK